MPVMTTAQALVKFLDNQYVCFDGKETKFVYGIYTVFGHGIVCGLGQALDADPGELKVLQGKNEQGMAHAAASFAKQNNRRRIIACSSSIGPGAANMVTAAATATVNNIPLLLFPADTFSTRQPDPVLQQFEQSDSLSITTNDAFRPVCRYWDRITRPEQLMSAMINAMRVLTDVGNTGAVCIALSQDVEGESYDFPEYFLQKRVHRIVRPVPCGDELSDIAGLIRASQKPLLIAGGGVRYSEAGEAVENFCTEFNIPFAETQSGKSAVLSSHPLNLGGVGVTGNSAANTIAAEADLVIGVGTRFSDFTTGSKSLYANPNVRFVTINTDRFDAYKLDAVKCVADAKLTIQLLGKLLAKVGYCSSYTFEIANAKAAWDKELQRLSNYTLGNGFEPLIAAREKRTIPEFIKLYGSALTQTEALAVIRSFMDDSDIAVAAAGSLPGCMQRMWTTNTRYTYNMEYGYSCMGYEIAGALGSKLAAPDREVYSFCGDGSWLMLHSEFVTSLQEGAKINVLLFDNAGFGCINNLEMNSGIGNLATEFRKRDETGNLNGELLKIDYARVASGYGANTFTAHTREELVEALKLAKASPISTLIDIKVLPKTMTAGYGAWWHVGLASVSDDVDEQNAYENKQKMLNKARRY